MTHQETRFNQAKVATLPGRQIPMMNDGLVCVCVCVWDWNGVPSGAAGKEWSLLLMELSLSLNVNPSWIGLMMMLHQERLIRRRRWAPFRTPVPAIVRMCADNCRRRLLFRTTTTMIVKSQMSQISRPGRPAGPARVSGFN